MKAFRSFTRTVLALFFLVSGATQLHAEITVRLSVKFILDSNGSRPSGNISNSTGFATEITRGNLILAATGRAYKLQVVESFDIQPPAPAGSNANYWFTLPARANRATIEAAALADQATWRWNGAALNMYVNGSSSGQCSFVGGGSSISFGGSVGSGTVLHEVGHFFNLKHTHTNDYASNTSPLIFRFFDLGDGDGLVETAFDNPNITNNNQLCVAYFDKAYTNASPAEQAVVDSAYENVMSYHNENVLLPVQMDIWGLNANGARLFVCSGRTRFVAIEGSDGNSGDNADSPFATLPKGLSTVGGQDDVVLLRSGNYISPPGGVLNTPCTLSATRGGASIVAP